MEVDFQSLGFTQGLCALTDSYTKKYILEEDQLYILSLWVGTGCLVVQILDAWWSIHWMTGGPDNGCLVVHTGEHPFHSPSGIIRWLSGGLLYVQALTQHLKV